MLSLYIYIHVHHRIGWPSMGVSYMYILLYMCVSVFDVHIHV